MYTTILLASLISTPSYPWEPLPQFNHNKVQEDIAWATRYGYDPYLVLAHIRVESGLKALYGTSNSRDTSTHTYTRSHTGDYGRHQINCTVWKQMQQQWKAGYKMYSAFPKNAVISHCSDLYRDDTNRLAYYYHLSIWRNYCTSNRIKHNIPRWLGHYQTGYAKPRMKYLKKLRTYSNYYRSWLKQIFTSRYNRIMERMKHNFSPTS